MHQGCDFAEMPQKMVPKRPKRRVKAQCVHPDLQVYPVNLHVWWFTLSIFGGFHGQSLLVHQKMFIICWFDVPKSSKDITKTYTIWL